MKKLITIILSLIMTFFAVPNQSADQTHVAAVNPPQTEITITVEQVPEESEKSVETAFVNEVAEAETMIEAPKEEASVFQETVTEECTGVTEETITEPEKKTVECIDECDQRRA